MPQKGMALCLSVFLVCVGIKVFAQEKSEDRVESKRLIAQVGLSSWIEDSLRVSPDGKRVAYVAGVGNKQLVVVDGKEERQYDDIGAGSPIFSPDGKRVAYGAKVGNKWFVVVDRKEGGQYDSLFTGAGGRIVFNSPNSLHCFAREGDKIYLVEEKIK
ncbi:MAG: hypothetical protein QMD05_10980 [Candidatus Brocadiaceae bacterium]|nr:hypothetical protein [Candidatus Brocadiaceae bacterium]